MLLSFSFPVLWNICMLENLDNCPLSHCLAWSSMVNTSRTVCVGQDFKDNNYVFNIQKHLLYRVGTWRDFILWLHFMLWPKNVLYIFKIWVNFILGLVSHPLKNWHSPSHLGGFSGDSVNKESSDPGSFPGWGRCPGEGNDNPLQCFCLENN